MNDAELERFQDCTQYDYVVDLRDRKVLHFGYIGRTGLIICYPPGECNMQDAIGLKPERVLVLDVDCYDFTALANRRI